MLKHLKYFLVFMLSACASQSPLTGGDKDTQPPKLVFSNPPNKTLQVKPKQIEFQFDEFIQLRSLQQKLIVSPPLKNPIEVKQKPKGFLIHINDTLLDETTYQWYFADAIVDLTEGNPIEGMTYVFSTGKYIDSLTISGKVVDAFTLQPDNNFIVCLYSDTTDSVLVKHNPSFISRSANDGHFMVTYIKPGKYKMVAFHDKNNNYRWDAETEKIAFYDSIIELNKSKDSINLYSFQEERERQYIKKAERKKNFQGLIVFNQPSKQKPIVKNSTALIHQTIYSTYYDSLTIYFADSTQYSKDTIQVTIEYPVIDSLQQLHLKAEEVYLTLENSKPKSKESSKATYKLTVKNNQTISSQTPINITFSEPYHLNSTECLLVMLKEDSTYFPQPLQIIQHENNPLTYTLKATLLDGRNYRLIFNFNHSTYYGQKFTNDTINFSTLQIEDYGTLTVNYQLPYERKAFVFELLNEKGNPVITWTDMRSSSKKTEHLLPGKYTLRCFYDENNDGKWNNGFYFLKKQPEKLMYYPKIIQLRANWEMELSWKITLP